MSADVVCWREKGIGRCVVGPKEEPTSPVSGDLGSAAVGPAMMWLDSVGAAQTQSVYGLVNSGEVGYTSPSANVNR